MSLLTLYARPTFVVRVRQGNDAQPRQGCSTHKLDVHYRDARTAHLNLARKQSYAGNRDFILHYRLTGAQPETGLLLYEGPREKHFLLMLQPPARVQPAVLPAREYVFVLDVSGSMQGPGAGMATTSGSL